MSKKTKIISLLIVVLILFGNIFCLLAVKDVYAIEWQTWNPFSSDYISGEKNPDQRSLWDDIFEPSLSLTTIDASHGRGAYAQVVDQRPTRIIALLVYEVFVFLGAIFIVLIIYSGFLWMFSSGNQERITKAKDIARNSIIGLAIILASYGITYFVFQGLTSTIY